MRPYDALVLYDMPGMSLDAPPLVRPEPIELSEKFKRSFLALIEQGKGIVALHHALAG